MNSYLEVVNHNIESVKGPMLPFEQWNFSLLYEDRDTREISKCYSQVGLLGHLHGDVIMQ